MLDFLVAGHNDAVLSCKYLFSKEKLDLHLPVKTQDVKRFWSKRADCIKLLILEFIYKGGHKLRSHENYAKPHLSVHGLLLPIYTATRSHFSTIWTLSLATDSVSTFNVT